MPLPPRRSKVVPIDYSLDSLFDEYERQNTKTTFSTLMKHDHEDALLSNAMYYKLTPLVAPGGGIKRKVVPESGWKRGNQNHQQQDGYNFSSQIGKSVVNSCPKVYAKEDEVDSRDQTSTRTNMEEHPRTLPLDLPDSSNAKIEGNGDARTESSTFDQAPPAFLSGSHDLPTTLVFPNEHSMVEQTYSEEKSLECSVEDSTDTERKSTELEVKKQSDTKKTALVAASLPRAVRSRRKKPLIKAIENALGYTLYEKFMKFQAGSGRHHDTPKEIEGAKNQKSINQKLEPERSKNDELVDLIARVDKSLDKPISELCSPLGRNEDANQHVNQDTNNRAEQYEKLANKKCGDPLELNIFERELVNEVDNVSMQHETPEDGDIPKGNIFLDQSMFDEFESSSQDSDEEKIKGQPSAEGTIGDLNDGIEVLSDELLNEEKIGDNESEHNVLIPAEKARSREEAESLIEDFSDDGSDSDQEDLGRDAPNLSFYSCDALRDVCSGERSYDADEGQNVGIPKDCHSDEADSRYGYSDEDGSDLDQEDLGRDAPDLSVYSCDALRDVCSGERSYDADEGQNVGIPKDSHSSPDEADSRYGYSDEDSHEDPKEDWLNFWEEEDDSGSILSETEVSLLSASEGIPRLRPFQHEVTLEKCTSEANKEDKMMEVFPIDQEEISRTIRAIQLRAGDNKREPLLECFHEIARTFRPRNHHIHSPEFDQHLDDVDKVLEAQFNVHHGKRSRTINAESTNAVNIDAMKPQPIQDIDCRNATVAFHVLEIPKSVVPRQTFNLRKNLDLLQDGTNLALDDIEETVKDIQQLLKLPEDAKDDAKPKSIKINKLRPSNRKN